MKTKKHIETNTAKEEFNVFEKRFLMMMKLFRLGKMMKNAKITYPSV